MKISKDSANKSIKNYLREFSKGNSLLLLMFLLCGPASFSHVALGDVGFYVFSGGDSVAESWVGAIKIDEDADLDRYRYSVLPNRVRGTLIKALSSGRAIITENTDQHLIGKYVFVEREKLNP